MNYILEQLKFITIGLIPEFGISINWLSDGDNSIMIAENLVFFVLLLIISLILIIVKREKIKQTGNKLILIDLGILVVKTEILILIYFREIFITVNLCIIVYGALVYFRRITGYSIFVRRYREKNPVKIFAINFPIKKAQQIIGEKIELVSRIKSGLEKKTISVNSLVLIIGITVIIMCIYKIVKTLILQQLGIFIVLGAIIHYINFENSLISTMKKVGKRIIEEGIKKVGIKIDYVVPEETQKIPTNKEEQQNINPEKYRNKVL